MIKKISKIKDFAVFNDFDCDKSVLNKDGKPFQFEKLNIIYGRNYSGKTTLSRILRSLETGKIPENCGNPTFTVSFCDDSDITQENIAGCTKSVRVFNTTTQSCSL